MTTKLQVDIVASVQQPAYGTDLGDGSLYGSIKPRVSTIVNLLVDLRDFVECFLSKHPVFTAMQLVEQSIDDFNKRHRATHIRFELRVVD